MQWQKKGVDKPASQALKASQYSRLAGMIQVCRPNMPAKNACNAACVLFENGITEFREVGSFSDYLVYLEIQLARYAHEISNDAGLMQSCEFEVSGWADYWQRHRDIS